MPSSFVPIDKHLVQLLASHALVTPNERLAREYRRAYDEHQHASGLTGWRTPAIVTLPRLLASELQRARDLNMTGSRIASRAEILNRAFASPAASPERDLGNFLSAWRMIQEYDIPLDAAEFSDTRTRAYAAWIRDVYDRLPPMAIPEERIADVLIAIDLAPPTPLILTDFDQFTRPQSRYLDFAAARGHVRTTRLHASHNAWPVRDQAAATPLSPDSPLVACSSLQQELIAAARWAKQQVLGNSMARVGIVVPALSRHHARVARQVGAILDPDNGSASPSFDIAAGVVLADQPVWRDAVLLLSACSQGMNLNRVDRLARARHLRLDWLASQAPNWPAHLSGRVSATIFFQAVAPDHPLTRTLRESPSRATYAEWLQYIEKVLRAAGWPKTRTMGSTQYQAWQALQHTLQGSAAGAQPDRLDLADALQLLGGHLREQLFAPRRPPARIQVLGMLETTGLAFTHLWVCGMDEDTLPGRHVSHPFIPNRLAQRCGVPRTSPQTELAFAERTLAQWSTHAEAIAFSFTCKAAESLRQPSALLAHLGLLDRPDALPHPYYANAPDELVTETFVDDTGPNAEAGPRRGGSSLLQDQAECPFKAYARHRLGLQPVESSSHFPDAALRGMLLHDCLARLLSEYPSGETLAAATDEDLRSICGHVLAAQAPTLPQLFAEHEITRLARDLRAWIRFEMDRPTFKARELEQEHRISLGRSEFSIRVDRIDDVGDFQLIIDYKTSASTRLSDVTASPLRAVQLPLYSALHEEVGGVYYATIREGGCRVQGVADPACALPGARTASPAGDWDTQRRVWQQDLQRLAESFEAGDARVAPLPGSCDHCHLSSFCRIGSSAQ